MRAVGSVQYLDAEETAIYLTTLIGRPISVPYVRVLAHRNEWRRAWWGRRMHYRLDDVDITGNAMSGAQMSGR